MTEGATLFTVQHQRVYTAAPRVRGRATLSPTDRGSRSVLETPDRRWIYCVSHRRSNGLRCMMSINHVVALY